MASAFCSRAPPGLNPGRPDTVSRAGVSVTGLGTPGHSTSCKAGLQSWSRYHGDIMAMCTWVVSGRHTTYTGQNWTQEVRKCCLLVIQHGHWAETTRPSTISVAGLKIAQTQHRGSWARFLSGKRQYHRTYQLHSLHGFQHMIS